MQMNAILRSYNTFLIHSLQYNKFTILFFSTATALGYLSLPYLEQYHKSIKKKSKQKTSKNNDKTE
tara:strand:+ start:798 stop:995 length:198 start_codon:yes stop_codon:yes gene_type:complete